MLRSGGLAVWRFCGMRHALFDPITHHPAHSPKEKLTSQLYRHGIGHVRSTPLLVAGPRTDDQKGILERQAQRYELASRCPHKVAAH